MLAKDFENLIPSEWCPDISPKEGRKCGNYFQVLLFQGFGNKTLRVSFEFPPRNNALSTRVEVKIR